MKFETYNQVLQSCLERLFDGGVPLDEVISDYPHLRDRLRVDLETASRMQVQSSAFDPRPGFMKASREHLLGQLSHQRKTIDIIRRSPILRRSLFHPIALAFLIAMVVFLASGSVVFAAGNSLPGDNLYLFRSAAEKLQLALTADDVKGAELHLQFSQDYLVACAVLISKERPEDASKALRIYERHISRTGRILLELSPKNDRDLSYLQSDFNRTFLQDIEIFQVLLPGGF